MAKHNKVHKPARPLPSARKEPKQQKERKPLLLPVAVVFFVLVWLWAWLWYGDVFRIARESSFWSLDETLMQYMDGRPWAALWWAGLALLQFYRWPVVGALITAFLVSGSTWLLGYCLRLRGWWRLIQYLPAMLYLGATAYLGFDIYFEAQTGMIMGIPLLCFLVLLILALIIRSFAHGHRFPPIVSPPKDETPRQNRAQLAMIVLCIAVAMAITQWMRPYVRVVTTMQRQMLEEDWRGMAETARARADLSYRQIAAYYAIALVQTGEQASRLFDIRMDYDDPYIHGFNRDNPYIANYYLMDCDLHAGLVQTATRHAMEHLTMNGPSLRSLKMLAKCSLLRGEWAVASKYLRILEKVPFEGDFIRRYKPMLHNMDLVNADPEFKMVRLTEPSRDSFENLFAQPAFLGYNAALTEGRSINALWNSLLVHVYTKTMPEFIYRCQPMRGTLPPQTFAEALLMMSAKNPDVLQLYPGLEYNRTRLLNFMQDVKAYIGDYDTRKEHARELFPKYKGYYPYYYFFGNLKATRGHTKENEGSSNQGVN
ncbi:MAG: hypothetical protein IJ197_02365 [Bacteroidaceae bacterium]|nr:hypothetical protein [Bacteroidaceae bacterium]